ncbi:MAG: hypothetical protein GTN76_05230, partial [Candidatus Aenigmarchaeota archaeon]|nr:hypothetical protein [Candidatus Aenigmarchaeota archaeon]
MGALEIEFVDAIHDQEGEKHLYKCLAPHPYRRYKKRERYLEAAVPMGLRKEILLL